MDLRHVLRTHGVAIDWCFEVFSDPDIHIRYVKKTEQIADMMTKGFSKRELWDALMSMSGLVRLSSLKVSQTSLKPAQLCVQLPTATSTSSAATRKNSL